MTVQRFAAFAITCLLAPGAFAAKPSKDEDQPAAKPSTAAERDTPVVPAKRAKKVKSPDGKAVAEIPAEPEIKREWFPNDPAGNFTLGTMFSDHASGVFLDGITGIWSPQKRDAFLFLDSRYHYEDNDQFISSTGLGFRKLITGHDIIIGANVFWDSVRSEHHNDINQLGLGVEILTRWVDAHFNYYLPEDDRFEVDRHSSFHSHSNVGSSRVDLQACKLEYSIVSPK